MSQTSFLSDSILFKIFTNLDYFGLIKCRLICKVWRETIRNQFPIEDLIVIIKQFPYNSDWWYSDDLFLIEHSLKRPKVHFVKCNLFEKLKKLLIYNHPINSNKLEQFDLECLNSLPNLEHFEIKNFHLISKCFQLNLTKLKRLRFNEVKIDRPNVTDNTNQNIRIELYLPSLDTFQFMNSSSQFFELFNFKCPSSIRIVECNHYYLQMNEFKNLERLFCRDLSDVSDDFLKNFKHLKEIVFYLNYDTFQNLKRQRAYQNSTVNLFYSGLKKDIGDLDDFKFMLENKFYFLYSKEYKNLATRIPFPTYILYNDLIRSFVKKSYAYNFTLKFNNIICVKVNDFLKEDNQLVLIGFIGRCPGLTHLIISRSYFKQLYFESLPFVVPNLSYFVIESEIYLKKLNFIFEFENLLKFKTDIRLNLDFVEKILPQLEYLQYSLMFKTVRILQTGNQYDVLINDENKVTFDRNQLTDLMDYLKNFYPNHLFEN